MSQDGIDPVSILWCTGHACLCGDGTSEDYLNMNNKKGALIGTHPTADDTRDKENDDQMKEILK